MGTANMVMAVKKSVRKHLWQLKTEYCLAILTFNNKRPRVVNKVPVVILNTIQVWNVEWICKGEKKEMKILSDQIE